MVYTNTYNLSDLPEIIGDLIGTILVAIIDRATDYVDLAITGAFVGLAIYILYRLGAVTKIGSWLKFK